MKTPLWLDTLAKRFNRLELRQRVLITCAMMFLMCFFAWVWFIESALIKKTQLVQKKNATQVALEKQVLENNQRLAKLKDDPNAVVSAQIAQVQERLLETQGQMASLTLGLTTPQKMPNILKRALAINDQLKIIEFITLPVVELLPPESKANLYQHGIELFIEGRFIDIFQFLSRLEDLSGHLYWRYFDYQVINYPFASVKIEIYTLSIDREFIHG